MSTVTVDSAAHEICAAFFKAMDDDGNGFLEEDEIVKIAAAFGETEEKARERFAKMLKDMDENGDGKHQQHTNQQKFLRKTKAVHDANGGGKQCLHETTSLTSLSVYY